MAWLITQRSAIQGKLDRYQRSIEAAKDRMKSTRNELKALDKVIGLHEVKVNPAAIKGKPPNRTRIFAKGKLSRFIIKICIQRGVGVAVAPTEVTVLFLEELNMPLNSATLRDMRSRVQTQMRNLKAKGILQRHDVDPKGGPTPESQWSLKAPLDF